MKASVVATTTSVAMMLASSPTAALSTERPAVL
jgi:hypothetical protein